MNQPRNFLNKHIYHVYNRGVAKQNIFNAQTDYQRLLDRFTYYLDYSTKPSISDLSHNKLKELLARKPTNRIVKIINYCLMPNHFHLIIQQTKQNGISQFIKDALNSYSRYFNTKYERIGPIFQGRFKAIEVETDEQLMHLSRYLHLNPFTAKMTQKPELYPWSSYNLCQNNFKTRLCDHRLVMRNFNSTNEYKNFIDDYKDYIISIQEIDNLLIE